MNNPVILAKTNLRKSDTDVQQVVDLGSQFAFYPVKLTVFDTFFFFW